jgi:hypothetical protein
VDSALIEHGQHVDTVLAPSGVLRSIRGLRGDASWTARRLMMDGGWTARGRGVDTGGPSALWQRICVGSAEVLKRSSASKVVAERRRLRWVALKRVDDGLHGLKT